MTHQPALFPDVAPTDNPAADLRPSTRYLCLTCQPNGDIFTSDDEEPECPKGAEHYVMHVSVIECPACGAWCDERDVDIFRRRHVCLAMVS